ncbi:MAG: hypothetical protein LBP65_01155 [Puniceicoccales bacterium]|jgi:hypothetical protein|nr:hypothetical protein [Puniceicoccales bacterium]
MLAAGEAFLRSLERRAGRELLRDLARQNAMAAMEMALDVLQSAVRNGTYVTASAANGVLAERNGSWTGVWRVEGGKTAKFDRWLVSADPNRVQDPGLPMATVTDGIALLRDLGSDELCPLLRIVENGRCRGHYAFWIDDENAKIWPAAMAANSSTADRPATVLRRMFSGQDLPWPEDGLPTLPIPKKLRRSVTDASWGVLQNTAGELLLDIAAKLRDGQFLENEPLFPKIADLPPPPSFAILAAHIRQQPTGGYVDAVPGGPYIRQKYPGQRQIASATEGTMQRMAGVHPVLCGHWLTVAAERMPGAVRLTLVPQFALWNPLAVGIRPHTFSLELRTMESADRSHPPYLPRLIVRSQQFPQGKVVALGDGETGTIFYGTCTAGWEPGEVKIFSPKSWQTAHTSGEGAMAGPLADDSRGNGGWEVILPMAGDGQVEVERLWSPLSPHSRWDGLTLRLWIGETCVQEVADFVDDGPSHRWQVATGQRLAIFRLSAVLRAGTGMAGDCRWLANYNPRAPQIRRSAFEHFSIAGVPAGLFHRHFAPWRTEFTDLPNSDGPSPKFFGSHSGRAIVFDFPSTITSLALLGQIVPTPFSYHPAVAVGNSWASPLVPRDSTHCLAPPIGGQDMEYFCQECRMDYSYLLNAALYDHYFVAAAGQSSIPCRGETEVSVFEKDRSERMMRAGMFNVNGSSVGAWKLLLRALPYDAGRRVYYLERFPGQRFLPDFYQSAPTFSAEELDRLAECITFEILRRGPFASLSSFVNRSLGDPSDPNTRCGALQAAIEAAQLRHFPNIPADDGRGRAWFDEAAAAGDANVGVPGDLTQADLLHFFGNFLAVRGDTFRIRSYGDGMERWNGNKTISAVAEALVRRLPDGSLELIYFHWIEPGYVSFSPFNNFPVAIADGEHT